MPKAYETDNVVKTVFNFSNLLNTTNPMSMALWEVETKQNFITKYQMGYMGYMIGWRDYTFMFEINN